MNTQKNPSAASGAEGRVPAMPQPIAEERSGMKVLIAFLLGLIVGVGGMWLWLAPADEEEDAMMEEENGGTVLGTEESEAPITQVPATAIDGSTFLVESQSAGSGVAVTVVEFGAGGGWVVIHEDLDGELGNALGARRFDEGIWSGTVSLLRNTEVGKTYHAVMYDDDGDKEFNLKTDLPMQSGGALVEVVFETQ